MNGTTTIMTSTNFNGDSRGRVRKPNPEPFDALALRMIVRTERFSAPGNRV